jgi:hypothetical protein
VRSKSCRAIAARSFGYGAASARSRFGSPVAHTYQGVGAHGLAQQTSGVIGGVAQGLTLTLSGIDPKALALLDPAEVKGALVTLYRLIFAVDAKTLLDWAFSTAAAATR